MKYRAFGRRPLATLRDDRVGFYVDEDPSRVGKDYSGRPVYHPSYVPSGSEIIVIFPPGLAEQVAQHLGRPTVHYHTALVTPAMAFNLCGAQ